MTRFASLALIASLTLASGCGAAAGAVVAIPVVGAAIGYSVGHAKDRAPVARVGDALLGFLTGGLVDIGVGYMALRAGANSD